MGPVGRSHRRDHFCEGPVGCSPHASVPKQSYVFVTHKRLARYRFILGASRIPHWNFHGEHYPVTRKTSFLFLDPSRPSKIVSPQMNGHSASKHDAPSILIPRPLSGCPSLVPSTARNHRPLASTQTLPWFDNRSEQSGSGFFLRGGGFMLPPCRCHCRHHGSLWLPQDTDEGIRISNQLVHARRSDTIFPEKRSPVLFLVISASSYAEDGGGF